MKHYNIQNYIRYKNDLDFTLNRLEGKMWDEYSRDELIIKFMPLVENIARKFATSQQASGVMAITDMIQEGHLNLIKAVDRILWEKIDQVKVKVLLNHQEVIRLVYLNPKQILDNFLKLIVENFLG